MLPSPKDLTHKYQSPVPSHNTRGWVDTAMCTYIAQGAAGMCQDSVLHDILLRPAASIVTDVCGQLHWALHTEELIALWGDTFAREVQDLNIIRCTGMPQKSL